MCPLVCLTAKLNSKSFTAARLGSNTNQHTDWTVGGTCINSSRSLYAPHLVQSCDGIYSSTAGVTMLTGFPRTRWPWRRFSESYAVRISVKVWRMCEFRVIMGIMTGLLGCCSSSTLGSRANDYVITLATLGLWQHHSPCSLRYWTNNTLAARSISPKYYNWLNGFLLLKLGTVEVSSLRVLLAFDHAFQQQ